MNETTNSVRRIPIWLLASLALNFLLVGFVIGQLPHGAPKEPPPKHMGPPAGPGAGFFLPPIGKVASQLSEETRQKFRENMLEARPELRNLRREMGEARREAFQVATADPFDLEAFEAALARHQELQSETQAIAQQAIVAFMQDLSAEQRQEFVSALQFAVENEDGRGRRGGRPFEGGTKASERPFERLPPSGAADSEQE